MTQQTMQDDFSTAVHRPGQVSPGTVLGLVVLFCVGLAIAVLNLLGWAVVNISADICEVDAVCPGRELFSHTFLSIAVAAFVLPLLPWIAVRRAWFKARMYLIALALLGPILADALAIAFAPDWL